MEIYGQFAAVYNRLMSDVDYKGWTQYLLELMRMGGLENETLAIADCACGTGDIAIELARRGHNVVGVDMSADMLAIAMEKARSSCVRMPFVQQNICSLKLHKPVDAITCTCDGINYILHRAQVKNFFESAAKTLKPQGLLLFDISSKYKFEHVLDGNVFSQEDDDTCCIWRSAYDKKTCECQLDITCFIRENAFFRRFCETHMQRAYEVGELCELLGITGYETLAVYGHPTHELPRAECERLQFVARKREISQQAIGI